MPNDAPETPPEQVDQPSPPAVLRLALSGYARFTDDDVKSAAAKLADGLATELEDLDYDPSDQLRGLTDDLNEAMNVADEESEVAEDEADEEEDGSWEDEGEDKG